MSPDALSVADDNAGTEESARTRLPPGWVWAKLREVGTWGSGGTPTSNNPDLYEGNIPWYRITDLNGGRLPKSEKTISELGLSSSSARLIEPPFLLLAMYGASIGKTGISTIRAATNQAIAWCRPHHDIDLDFVHFYLRHIQRSLVDQGQGGAQPNISRSILLEQPIPLAPTAEQRRIVARINELFAEIEGGEAALEQAREGLDAWHRALLKAAVTGELTRDWREANRPAETAADLLARIGTERGASASRSTRIRRSAASGTLDATSPPGLPDGWAWARLGECISHLTSGSRDWSQYYDQGSAIFIMAQNIRPGRYNHNYVKHVAPPAGDPETTRTQVRKNDLLVTIVGANTGDVCRVDFDAANYFVCQSVALARPVLPEISEFLELYFVAHDGGRGEFEKVIYGAGRPHLSFDQLLATRVPIPSLVEMREIMQRVRLQEEAAFSEQDLAGFRRDLLALRQSILKSAFEGRLVPQGPADEPASALLARLRNSHPGNGARRRRARAAADFFHPSLPGLSPQSVDPRVEPAGDE